MLKKINMNRIHAYSMISTTDSDLHMSPSCTVALPDKCGCRKLNTSAFCRLHLINYLKRFTTSLAPQSILAKIIIGKFTLWYHGKHWKCTYQNIPKTNHTIFNVALMHKKLHALLNSADQVDICVFVPQYNYVLCRTLQQSDFFASPLTDCVNVRYERQLLVVK
jgi:hypothetical protein